MASKKTYKSGLNKLLSKREKLIGKLPKLEEFIMGNIQKNLYFKCGTLKCKCKNIKNPSLHGPYTHLSIRSSQRTKNFYLKREMIKDMEKYIKNYDKLWNILLQLSLLNYQIYKIRKGSESAKKNN